MITGSRRSTLYVQNDSAYAVSGKRVHGDILNRRGPYNFKDL